MAKMFYIKEIDPFSFLHFSPRGNAFCLVKFDRTEDGTPRIAEVMRNTQNNPERYTRADIEKLAKCDFQAPSKNRDEPHMRGAWCDYVQALNETIGGENMCSRAAQVEFPDIVIEPPPPAKFCWIF